MFGDPVGLTELIAPEHTGSIDEEKPRAEEFEKEPAEGRKVE